MALDRRRDPVKNQRALRLHRSGFSQRDIMRQTGLARNTVRRIVAESVTASQSPENVRKVVE